MQPLQRAALRSTRRLRPQVARQQSRFESQKPHDSGHAHHTASGTESFGPGFFVAITAVPVAFLFLNYSTSGDKQPYFTRLIKDTYAGYANKWAQRNDVHTQMVEQAAADRVLFLNESNQQPRHVELRFPEIFNTGSPWNVPAGQGGANLDGLIAKYEKENAERQEEKMQQLRDNTVPREQPVKQFKKIAPAALDSGS